MYICFDIQNKHYIIIHIKLHYTNKDNYIQVCLIKIFYTQKIYKQRMFLYDEKSASYTFVEYLIFL
jgi:hypothetical protein